MLRKRRAGSRGHRRVKLFAHESPRDVPDEQQPVQGALIRQQHRVRWTARAAVARLSATFAVALQDFTELLGLFDRSIPDRSVPHVSPPPPLRVCRVLPGSPQAADQPAQSRSQIEQVHPEGDPGDAERRNDEDAVVIKAEHVSCLPFQDATAAAGAKRTTTRSASSRIPMCTRTMNAYSRVKATSDSRSTHETLSDGCCCASGPITGCG